MKEKLQNMEEACSSFNICLTGNWEEYTGYMHGQNHRRSVELKSESLMERTHFSLEEDELKNKLINLDIVTKSKNKILKASRKM